MGRFAGQVALVTGGGSGIGRAVALALAAEGAAVAVLGRGQRRLAETVELAQAAGGVASAVVADVTEGEAVAQAVAETVERHGGLHVAVNNAAANHPGLVVDQPERDFADTLAVNVTGVWLAMRHEIRHMREHGGGAIVNVASTLGAHQRRPGVGAYAASKAAVAALSRVAALENITAGVRVNAVSPGPVDTPMSVWPGETAAGRDARLARTLPLGRAGAVDEIAAAVLWLASPQASFVVGHDLVVDGGATA